MFLWYFAENEKWLEFLLQTIRIFNQDIEIAFVLENSL